MRSMFAVTVAVMLWSPSAWAGYSEDWNADNGQWQYWRGHGNEPAVQYVPSGGVANSGHMAVDLAMVGWHGPLPSPIDYLYWAAYYYAEDNGLGRLDFTDASVSFYAFGDNLALLDGQLHFYVQRWDQDTGEASLFRANAAVAIGEGSWQFNDWVVSSNTADWERVSGNDFTLTEVLTKATEFGFVITGVLDGPNPSGMLKLDEFATDALIIPEPAALALGGLGLTGLVARRKRR
jgi:hypothetical protein